MHIPFLRHKFFSNKLNIMKKFIALFALVAFVGVLTAPAATVSEQSNQVILDQSFDNDFDNNFDKDKDKDKDKKKKKKKNTKATKTVVKAHAEGGCGGCGEKAECEGEAAKEKKASSCEEEKKTEACCDDKTKGKKKK